MLLLPQTHIYMRPTHSATYRQLISVTLISHLTLTAHSVSLTHTHTHAHTNGISMKTVSDCHHSRLQENLKMGYYMRGTRCRGNILCFTRIRNESVNSISADRPPALPKGRGFRYIQAIRHEVMLSAGSLISRVVRSGWGWRLGLTGPFVPVSVTLARVSLTWGYASECTGVTNWKKQTKKKKDREIIWADLNLTLQWIRVDVEIINVSLSDYFLDPVESILEQKIVVNFIQSKLQQTVHTSHQHNSYYPIMFYVP